jgi:hypothetical protein
VRERPTLAEIAVVVLAGLAIYALIAAMVHLTQNP